MGSRRDSFSSLYRLAGRSNDDDSEETPMNKYMMATKAVHLLGDISRDTEDLCFVRYETETHYVGNWVTGFGFISVMFPKDTTRELTPDELKFYNQRYVQTNDQPAARATEGSLISIGQ
jgi:hypothetical protein